MSFSPLSPSSAASEDLPPSGSTGAAAAAAFSSSSSSTAAAATATTAAKRSSKHSFQDGQQHHQQQQQQQQLPNEEEELDQFLKETYLALEDIRFASYRTAAKLRLLQKQSYLHYVDIWNLIESFRETGWHTLESSSKVSSDGIHLLISNLYDSLSKRLPPAALSNLPPGGLQRKATLLRTYIMSALAGTPSASGRMDPSAIKVRTVKTILATLCTGKLMDKFRYIFSQLADHNGHLIQTRFQHFLRDILKIPAAVGELMKEKRDKLEIMFDPDSKVNVNDFLETMMSDPGPQCLSWLLVLHRLINAESVFHPINCGHCNSQGFHGLRYKSDCSDYHLCQNCFWRGKISPDHEHDVFKEFSSFKASSGKSFKRSIPCIPSSSSSSRKQQHHHHPPFSDVPEKPLDLTNMIPTPSSSRFELQHQHQQQQQQQQQQQHQQHNPHHHPHLKPGLDGINDEHNLIAQYATELANSQQLQQQQQQQQNHGSRHQMNNSHSSQVVQDLERRNQEIMNNISQLKKSTGAGGMLGQGRRRGAGSRGGQQNSTEYASELYHLRSHKDVLEERLLELQETRKDLMIELEELMKILQVQKLGGAGGGVGGPPTHQELSAAAHHFGGGGSYQNMSGEHHNNHEMSHMH